MILVVYCKIFFSIDSYDISKITISCLFCHGEILFTVKWDVEVKSIKATRHIEILEANRQKCSKLGLTHKKEKYWNQRKYQLHWGFKDLSRRTPFFVFKSTMLSAQVTPTNRSVFANWLSGLIERLTPSMKYPFPIVMSECHRYLLTPRLERKETKLG